MTILTDVVSTSSGTGDAGTGALTLSHTVTSSSDIVIAQFSGEVSGLVSDTPTITGVTRGGVPMTLGKATSISEGTGYAYTSVWYLLNPTPGTADIVTTPSNTTFIHCQLIAGNLPGRKAQAPEVTTETGTAVDGSTLSQSITTLTDNAAILSAIVTNTEGAAVSDQTQEGTAVSIGTLTSGSRGSIGSFVQSTAGAKTMSWVVSGGYQRVAMVNLSFEAAPVISLTLTDVATGRVYQRTGTTANITVAGTYAGTAPTTIEARVIDPASADVVAWTVLTSATIGGGSFSGTLPSVPQGGGIDSSVGYRLQVRSKDAGGVVIASSNGTHYWGVGDLVGLMGSSTMAAMITDATATTANVRLSKYTGTWAACTGAGAIALGNQMIADNPGIPVGFIAGGVGGTTLAQWYSAADSNYLAFLALITAVGGKLALVLCHVGSNDARNETLISQADHESKYRTLISNLRTALGQATMPVFLWGCQRAPDEPGGSDSYWSYARAAEMNVADDTNNYLACTVVDLPLAGDNVHLSTGATGGMATAGLRVARAIKSVLLGIGTYKGPKPTRLYYNSTSGWGYVDFVLGSGTSAVGLTGQTAITGWIFKAAGTPVSPVTQPYISSTNRVSFQLDASLSTVTLAIMPGTTPTITNGLFNNG